MNGYAVFDIETTGFRLHEDSIVEIAVVHVDDDGRITGMWDTLLRPRDGEVGPTRVHGISHAMVRDAPSFAELSPAIYGLFAGRIPVAHRIAQFDGRFLNAHFTWAGIATDTFTEGLCTWKLAARHLPLEHHTLQDCCTYLGIDLLGAHQALDDTIATAQLLGHFIRAGHAATGGGAGVRVPAGLTLSGPSASSPSLPAQDAGRLFYPRRGRGAAPLPRPTSADVADAGAGMSAASAGE
ncbi:3'-5' exonuclease [Actinospica durhamensis]|uniref:3'-5' exonuclease n=1 Tax=Actinospica durhamensis TaxID=1508375 RepID=A0A941IUN1_9ACTN|nr:3'-5' exonuclease [Actinospica durhamensis]MBR7839337.1 3'-5' exonuclease [Actinospica durhamensis]